MKVQLETCLRSESTRQITDEDPANGDCLDNDAHQNRMMPVQNSTRGIPTSALSIIDLLRELPNNFTYCGALSAQRGERLCKNVDKIET